MNPEKTNSVVGVPTRGNDSYGSSDFAKSPALDTKETGGVVDQPSIGGDYAMSGIDKSADITGAHGRVETTASEENRAAKFKYPSVQQDVPEKGRGQFETHS